MCLTTPPIVISLGLEAACREIGCYFNDTACLGMVQISTTLAYKLQAYVCVVHAHISTVVTKI
jgi:hypothetical protein